jgi:TonB family protein
MTIGNAVLSVMTTILTLLFFSSAAQAGSVIALDDKLDAYWVVEKKVAPAYPEQALSDGTSGCAAVGFIIQADGKTSDHKVLAHSPNNVFDRSAIQAAKRFRYTPSEQNPDKVTALTVNAFTFQISGAGRKFDSDQQKELVEICESGARKILEPHMVDSAVSGD